MRNVYLHGTLATNFTDKVTLEAASIPEIIKALDVNFKGFRSFLLNYAPGFFIREENTYKSKNNLLEPILSNSDIHIMPVIAGSGKIGLIIGGLVLIAMSGGFAAFGLQGLGGAAAATATTAATTGTMLSAGMITVMGQVGIALVMSGISAILFAPPKPTERKNTENTPNTYFNGVVNTTNQGVPVPIGYGELIVGSTVISAGITVSQTDTTDYPWVWGADTNWSTSAYTNGNYYNPKTTLYYNSTTNIYTWVTSTTYVLVRDEFDISGYHSKVYEIQSIVQDTYLYKADVNRFFKEGTPTKFKIKGVTSKYSSKVGNKDAPPNWGTGSSRRVEVPYGETSQ